MSSTERAPEPTMEEILASIRRIISDDESNLAPQLSAAPQSQDDDETLELSEGEVEGEADDKIINDIARVLSGGAPAPVEAVEEEEDILDLTAELGGLEPVEEELQVVEVVAEAEASAPEAEALAPEAEFQPEFREPEAELELGAEEETSEPEAAAYEPEVAAEPAQAPQAMSASEEAASALERAIAALRAGQLPHPRYSLTSHRRSLHKPSRHLRLRRSQWPSLPRCPRQLMSRSGSLNSPSSKARWWRRNR